MKSFDDKVVLVTGASQGIGRGVALAFAREGARVVLAARSVDRLARVQQEIHDLGSEALAVPTDVTSPAAVDTLIQTAIEKYGKIDVLVNNAGIGRVGAIDSMEFEEDVHSTLQASVFGMIHVTRRVLPILQATRQWCNRQHVVGDGTKSLRPLRLIRHRDARGLGIF